MPHVPGKPTRVDAASPTKERKEEVSTFLQPVDAINITRIIISVSAGYLILASITSKGRLEEEGGVVGGDMVVKKVMSLSRWAPPAPARRKRKCKVTVKVVGLEGLPPLPGEGRVAAVEVRWRQPPKVGALAYLMGRKKQARSVSSRRPVMEDSWAVRWDHDDEANRFQNVCRLCDPESVADPVHDVSFSILYVSSFTVQVLLISSSILWFNWLVREIYNSVEMLWWSNALLVFISLADSIGCWTGQ